MYLKMVGCLGIVAATSGYGYSRGMEYQRQITDTGELQRVIRQLAGEMEYTYAPLAQVCASVSRRCSQNYRIWLEHLAKELEKMTAEKKQSIEKICPECSPVCSRHVYARLPGDSLPGKYADRRILVLCFPRRI